MTSSGLPSQIWNGNLQEMLSLLSGQMSSTAASSLPNDVTRMLMTSSLAPPPQHAPPPFVPVSVAPQPLPSSQQPDLFQPFRVPPLSAPPLNLHIPTSSLPSFGPPPSATVTSSSSSNFQQPQPSPLSLPQLGNVGNTLLATLSSSLPSQLSTLSSLPLPSFPQCSLSSDNGLDYGSASTASLNPILAAYRQLMEGQNAAELQRQLMLSQMNTQSSSFLSGSQFAVPQNPARTKIKSQPEPPSSFRRPSTVTRPSTSTQFAVPHPRKVYKTPPICQPSTSSQAPPTLSKGPPIIVETTPIKTEPANEETPFEMGRLSTKTYHPTHFMKGTVIRLSSGKEKKVEDLSSDDFLLSSSSTRELIMEASQIVEVAKSKNMARVSFIVGMPKYETSIEVQLEYPFFVLGKGWSSCDPKRTEMTYGMDVSQLNVGDIAVTLTRRSEREAMQVEMAVSLLEAQRNEQKMAWRATMRQEVVQDQTKPEGGRLSAPPPRFHPYEKPRKTSES